MTAAVLVSFAVSPHAHADNAVLAPIHQLINGLLRVMKAGQGTPFFQRFDMLAPVIDQTFDLTTILRESIGATWDTLPPDQQTMLSKAFRRYTVVSYVNSFDEYNGQRFVVNPETRIVGDEQIVRMQIIPRTGETHELIMSCVRARRTGGWWMYWPTEPSAASRSNGPISAGW